MRKFMLFTAILAGTTNFSFATQGIRVAPGMRAGTSCSLTIDGSTVYNGLCNVVTEGSSTVINTGSDTYRIEIDHYGAVSGEFTDHAGNSYGRINANGYCWRGRHVVFCAE